MKEEEYKYLKELLGKINHEDISQSCEELPTKHIWADFQGWGSGKSYVQRRTTAFMKLLTVMTSAKRC